MTEQLVSPSQRLRLHASPNGASSAVRNSIISSSAKGWSPLQINKRDSVTSPLKPSPNPNSPSAANALSPDTSSPRRSSSSFKHVSRNSLVSNSPFKSPTTIQGQQAAGIDVDTTGRDRVIHERRSTAATPTRSLGQAAAPALGVAATPKAAIGLGISATKPRSSSGTSGSAVAGNRKVSTERGKVAFPTATGERKVSGGTERKVSGSKENESPDIRSVKRTPRQSMGLKGLAKGGLVSKSPFLMETSGLGHSRSTSGDGLAPMIDARAVDSPNSFSPKTIPIEKNDVFSSPSPRRVSGGKRHVSPASILARTSNSPSSSPPARLSSSSLTNLGRSPLGKPTHLEKPSSRHDDLTPTPTPHKSSITPSRRLRGPRGLADFGTFDSPSRQSKTVTFQSIPDVKEFERMSIEGSADGSFEVDRGSDDDSQEWIEDGVTSTRDDSLEILVDSAHLDHPSAVQHITDRLVGSSFDDASDTPDVSDGFGTPQESATADFMSALVEEGLFSPPELSTPSFANQPDFEEAPPIPPLPSQSGQQDRGSFLPTPSLGGSLHGTPMMEAALWSTEQENAGEVFDEKDEVGIPFGRTHHAQRAALAHSLPPLEQISPLEQPNIPHSSEHTMLLNANAAQPAIQSDNRDGLPGPHAHQAGPLPDPFITIQTTTQVLNPGTAHRKEDGIPLGRTSHAERTAAARLLATQSLGLGMPRSPAISKGLTEVKGEDIDLSYGSLQEERIKPEEETQTSSYERQEPVHVERKDSSIESPSRELVFDASFELNDGSSLFAPKIEPLAYGPSATAALPVLPTARKVSEVPEMVGPSRRMTQFKSAKSAESNSGEDELLMSPKRGLPKPPKVESLDLPSPVTSPSKREEVDERDTQMSKTEKRSSKFEISLPVSLPFIGAISPFFSTSANGTFTEPPQVPSSEPSRPLTPPPNIAKANTKHESPHRIPDFDFEEISLHAIDESGLPNSKVTTRSIVSPVRNSFQSTSTSSNRLSGLSESNSNRLSGLSGFSESTVSNRFSVISESTSFKSSSTTMSISSTGQDFGGKSSSNSNTSTTGKVRQRISREMIKETIQQRLADGSLSRKPSSLESRTASITAESQSQKNGTGMNKDLPPPPPPKSGIPMKKAHTTDASTSRKEDLDEGSTGDRPKMRPRSQTQSAHEVAKQNAKDGSLGNPQSALDKLMAATTSIGLKNSSVAEKEKVRVVSSVSKDSTNSTVPLYIPSGILQRPDQQKAVKEEQKRIPSGKVEMVIIASSNGGPKSTTGNADGNGGMAAREQAINAKRREKEGGNRNISGASTGSGGVRRRRSLSVGDATPGEGSNHRRSVVSPRLTLGIDDDNRSILDAFREEVGNIGSDRRYKVRERQVIHASSSGDDKVGQHGKAGDIDSGRAWRQLRRPSDMNEYAAEIRAMKAKEISSGKATGTIFVKVLGIENLTVPLPEQQTFFSITLDNGIDYIRTPYCVLADGARVNQEFSLVEHPNFEFSLSLDIRRDPHILKAIHEKLNPPPAVSAPSSSVKSSGLRSIFSSPRKPKVSSAPANRGDRSTTPLPILKQPSQPGNNNTIAKYFATPSSSTIAKTHVAFKPIAKNCEAKVLEIRYPMFAMFKGEPDRSTGPGSKDAAAIAAAAVANGQTRSQVAKITLQIMRLPPIPGLSVEDLPGSIDDCLRGMRHHSWWEHEYHEGVLTQEGGDCKNPKRRLFKLVGGNLIAINEVTKKEVTSISLRQATGVVDLNATLGSPASRITSRPRGSDEGFSARPRSFLVEFGDGEGIVFAADKDSEKAVWMTTLNGLIGKIPTNPLWAELLAAKQREQATKPRSTSSNSIVKDGKRIASGNNRRKASANKASANVHKVIVES